MFAGLRDKIKHARGSALSDLQAATTGVWFFCGGDAVLDSASCTNNIGALGDKMMSGAS
jgi:hypothetical protein